MSLEANGNAALLALLERAMADAALARVEHAREVVAVDMHIAFMRAASGPLQASGRATGGGRSVCFCEATVLDAGGAVAARAMGTFRYRDRERDRA
jgi:acyl-coenzyme A thioesterase PaaI-like protein